MAEKVGQQKEVLNIWNKNAEEAAQNSKEALDITKENAKNEWSFFGLKMGALGVVIGSAAGFIGGIPGFFIGAGAGAICGGAVGSEVNDQVNKDIRKVESEGPQILKNN